MTLSFSTPMMLRALDRDGVAKALAKNLYWQASCPPADPLAVADQTFVLGKLSFKGLFQAELQLRSTCLVDAHSSTMSGLTVEVPEAKELHMALEVYEYLPVSHKAPADVSTGGCGCSIALMMMALVGQDLSTSSVLMGSAEPDTHSIFDQQLRFRDPQLEHNAQAGDSVSPHVKRNAWMWNLILCGSAFIFLSKYI